MIEYFAQYFVNKEHFTDEDTYDNLYIGWTLFTLVTSIIAAYLSWRCNEKSNYPLSVKVVCALNAFSFGIFYIIYYLLFKVEKTCSKFKLIEVESNKVVEFDSHSLASSSLPLQKTNSFKTSNRKSLNRSLSSTSL
jgi:hypothetical protein